MIEQLGLLLDYIGGAAQAVSEFDFKTPLRLIGALLVITGSVASIAAIRQDYKFETLKWSGVPRSAALTLQTSLLVLALLGAGLSLITIFKGDIPQWASSLLPGAIALVALALLLREVFFRPTFKIQRFWDYAIYPMLSPLLGLVMLTLPQLAEITRQLLG